MRVCQGVAPSHMPCTARVVLHQRTAGMDSNEHTYTVAIHGRITGSTVQSAHPVFLVVKCVCVCERESALLTLFGAA